MDAAFPVICTDRPWIACTGSYRPPDRAKPKDDTDLTSVAYYFPVDSGPDIRLYFSSRDLPDLGLYFCPTFRRPVWAVVRATIGQREDDDNPLGSDLRALGRVTAQRHTQRR